MNFVDQNDAFKFVLLSFREGWGAKDMMKYGKAGGKFSIPVYEKTV